MKHSVDLARIGLWNTYPNPAVGCVLVRMDDVDTTTTTNPPPHGLVIGTGFHPRSGMPHAEIFALLEACGHIDDGVLAAQSVMYDQLGEDNHNDNDDTTTLLANRVEKLLDTYKSTNGTATLFGGRFLNVHVTAYVTLEPCCHWGKTPPCASALVAAGVKRVVVGCRDPNPRVDGGGVHVLEGAGVDVQIVDANMAEECGCDELIQYFVKRISPPPPPPPRRQQRPNEDGSSIHGKRRRALRSIAGRRKKDGTIHQIEWRGKKLQSKDDDDDVIVASSVPIDHRFLEALDASLWDHEMVLLRLNSVVQKKKEAKTLSGRVAEILDAHVVQVIGHTALLYRPAIPPILDLDKLVVTMEHPDGDDSE